MATVDVFAPTEHHLFPRSQRPRNIRHNRVMIPLGIHQAWHLLVRDETPEGTLMEIVQHWLPIEEVRIVNVELRYWRGQIRPITRRYADSPKKTEAFNLVFPTDRPLEVLKLWTWQWVPPDYVRYLSVLIGQDEHVIAHDSPDTDLIAKIRHRQQRKLAELQNSHCAR